MLCQLDEAITRTESALSQAKLPVWTARLGWYYGLAGKKEDALACLKDLEELSSAEWCRWSRGYIRYNADMSTHAADYLDAIAHLPEGAALTMQQFSWEDYERLVEQLQEEGLHVRVSYDRGKLEIMSPLPEHEQYARFIDRLLYALSEILDLKLQSYGSATWKRQRLARGAEPDCCYYVANAERVIGKRKFDLEIDPPPDIVVEIDITNESLSKFPIYAALSVSEIWRYDGKTIHFYELAAGDYHEVFETRSVPGLTPPMLASALEAGKTDQTQAVRAFRQQWGSKP